MSRASIGWRRVAGTMLAIVLGACGVGGEGTGGTSGPVMVAGRVEGFGSIVVAGNRLDEAGAELRIEIDPRRPQAAPITALRLGMVVQVQARSGEARQVVVAPEVVGPVQAVDARAGRLVVAGQVVRLDAAAADPTLLDGLRSLPELRLGDRVRVHGDRDTDGSVRASRLEREPAGTVGDGVRVAGTIEAAPGGGWRIGALLLAIDPAAERRPAGRAPAAGDRVEAWGPGLDPQARLLTAVLQWPTPAAEDTAALLAGVLSGPDAQGRWRVRGQPIDAASLAPADRDRLAPGVLVRVSGRLRGALLAADRLEVVDAARPATAEVVATVGDTVDGRAFSLRGTPVDATSARFDALTPANIANGVPVAVRGRISAGGLVADAVQAQVLAEGIGHAQAGTVTRLDSGGRTLRLEGLATPIRLAADVVYRQGTAADLADGVPVVLRGANEAGTFVARVVEFGAPGSVVELAGLVGNVEADETVPGRGEFEIGPTDMAWTSATVFLGPTGTAADLVDGRFARVRGVRDGNVLRAVEVDLRPSQPGVVRLRGTVTAVSSPQAFRVDGQRVDASGAVFDPPDLARQLAGAFVDVEGQLRDGVLVATRVSDP